MRVAPPAHAVRAPFRTPELGGSPPHAGAVQVHPPVLRRRDAGATQGPLDHMRLKQAVPWVVTVLALGAAAMLLLPARSANGHHPDPRTDREALALTVLPAASLTGNPDAAEVYDIARQIPETLDGLYCHCHCKESLGHRSLLTCFQSEHGSHCE